MQKWCNFCGGIEFEEKKVEYLYSREGKYLLVPDTPVEICKTCGMLCYDAAILKEIERRFFAIHENAEQPDYYIQMPVESYA